MQCGTWEDTARSSHISPNVFTWNRYTGKMCSSGTLEDLAIGCIINTYTCIVLPMTDFLLATKASYPLTHLLTNSPTRDYAECVGVEVWEWKTRPHTRTHSQPYKLRLTCRLVMSAASSVQTCLVTVNIVDMDLTSSSRRLWIDVDEIEANSCACEFSACALVACK